jgi:hypothetical protein
VGPGTVSSPVEWLCIRFLVLFLPGRAGLAYPLAGRSYRNGGAVSPRGNGGKKRACPGSSPCGPVHPFLGPGGAGARPFLFTKLPRTSLLGNPYPRARRPQDGRGGYSKLCIKITINHKKRWFVQNLPTTFRVRPRIFVQRPSTVGLDTPKLRDNIASVFAYVQLTHS